QKSVEIMTALNPERIFRIHLPFDRAAAAWHSTLTSAGLNSDAGRLDAANAILPGRINLTQLSAPLAAALSKAAETARSSPADSAAFREQAAAFLDQATGGHYRVRDGFVDAVEFTSIYPAGTVEGTTTYQGEKLPDFGVTGIWPLIPRTQGRGQI